jgi:hypothetical protein
VRVRKHKKSIPRSKRNTQKNSWGKVYKGNG